VRAETPWIVADTIQQRFECGRCHEIEPMPTNIRVDDFTRIALRFVEEHKDCKPKAVYRRPVRR